MSINYNTSEYDKKYIEWLKEENRRLAEQLQGNGDSIRIYAGKSYIQLDFEDIKGVEVRDTCPPLFVVTTPFGEFPLTGNRAEDTLKEFINRRQNEKQGV